MMLSEYVSKTMEKPKPPETDEETTTGGWLIKEVGAAAVGKFVLCDPPEMGWRRET